MNVWNTEETSHWVTSGNAAVGI